MQREYKEGILSGEGGPSKVAEGASTTVGRGGSMNLKPSGCCRSWLVDVWGFDTAGDDVVAGGWSSGTCSCMIRMLPGCRHRGWA